jgi:hypothetical protein
MSAAELVRYLTNALFLVIFVAVARTALRERNRASLNTTLLFGAIALVIALSQITAVLGVRDALLSVLSILLLLALPYLQLRLVDDFAGVRPIVKRVCVAGLGIAALAAALGGLGIVDLAPAAAPLIAVGVLYFFGFGAYAAIGFGREALRTAGVARRRMALAAGGSLALSLTLLVAASGPLLGPTLSSGATLLLGLISACAFAAAFAPPSILRRAWREPALRSFFSSAAAISPLESRTDIISKLEAGAARATSARARSSRHPSAAADVVSGCLPSPVAAPRSSPRTISTSCSFWPTRRRSCSTERGCTRSSPRPIARSVRRRGSSPNSSRT